MPDPHIIRSTGAARILTDAVNAAHDRGLTVVAARDLGVICTSIVEPTWEVDPRAATAISPLGAVLLDRKPPIVNIDMALSWVFGSRPEFHEGIEDGVVGQRDMRRDDKLYLDGVFIGAQLRELIQRRQGVPIERSAIHAVSTAGYADAAAIEPTRPVETPKAVLASLLAKMSVPDALEAMADGFEQKRAQLGGDAADDLNVFEQTLRELAAEARAWDENGDEPGEG